MKKLILFISLVISIAVSAQTYNGNITLLTQQDVDNFPVNYPGITGVNGVLEIGPANGPACNISDLSSLQNLTYVYNLRIWNTSLSQINGLNNVQTPYLIISDNNSLTTINGFNGISYASSISINESNLQTISGFNQLTNIYSILDIIAPVSSINGFASLVNSQQICIRNTNLTTLSFLNNISTNSIKYLLIYNNSQLISLNAFQTIQTIVGGGGLQLSYNPQLADISGLSNLTTVAALNIWGNSGLTDLNSLNNLQSIQGDFNLMQINNIQNISGLNSLNTIGGNLKITDNTILNNLSAFNHPITITGSVSIISNPNLTNCAAQSICNYLGVNSANATITGNATGCNSISEVTYACNPVPLTKIRTQDCGLQTTTFNQLFYCNSITGATYEFRYRDVLTNAVTTRLRPSTTASLGDAGLLDINRTYSVRVRALLNNVWGNYGDSCLIYSPIQVPLTKIRTLDCGLQTTTFNQLFYADVVSYSTGNYDFEFTDIATNIVTIKSRPNNIASLGDAGLFELNKTYSVRVRTKVGNNWGNYGPACLIYSPTQVPLTKIRTLDCGLQTTTFNQLFYADAVSYSTGNYDFEFTDIATNIVTIKSRPNNIASLGDAGLLELNKTYSVRVRTKVGNNWGNYGPACLIYSPTQVPLTKIRTLDCGLQTTTFNQLFYADAVSYSTGDYDFEFTDIATNIVTIKSRPNNIVSLGDAALFELNKTYSVRVRTKVGNNWGNYGTACLIYSPTQVPLTKIRTLDCGLQTTTFTQLYYADAVSYATNYEFEYVDINTNAITYRVRPNNAAYLGDAGLNQYNKIYNVRVRAKVGNNWGAFGTVCQIKSPINITQVNSANCNIAYSIPDLFSCDPVPNANAYEFEFTNTTTNVITTNIVTTTANSFATAGLPYYSKTYSVRVRARIGTTWGSYGAPCILKSICSTCLRLASNDESTIDDSKNTSSIVIYPNPTTDILNISDLTESSTINVFNVSGQLVLTKSSIDTNEKIDLSALDNGIYMIVIEGKNGEIAKRQRVVLAK